MIEVDVFGEPIEIANQEWRIYARAVTNVRVGARFTKFFPVRITNHDVVDWAVVREEARVVELTLRRIRMFGKELLASSVGYGLELTFTGDASGVGAQGVLQSCEDVSIEEVKSILFPDNRKAD